MTEQQRQFCENYLKCANGTKAAILAGYSAVSARSQASQILAIVEIEEYLDKRREEISKKSLVDISWLQIKQKEVIERCMQHEPVLEKIDGEWVETGEYKFDASGANKGIETLLKVVGGFEKDNEQSKTHIQISLSKEEAQQIAKDLEDKF